MNANFSYLLNVIFALVFFFIVFKKCNPAYKDTKIIFVDSSSTKQLKEKNAEFDRLSDVYQSKEIMWSDSIEKLTKGLTIVKTKFIVKYRNILKDSLVTDSNCLYTLEAANETINYYDSVVNIQSKQYNNCLEQNTNLENQIKLNRNFAELSEKDKATLIKELSKFDHRFWRWYHKSRK